jgi:hypothetical protein
VVPCSHELKYDASGKCDTAFIQKTPEWTENIPRCSYENNDISKCNKVLTLCKDMKNPSNVLCQLTRSYQVDWSYYLRFYEEKNNCEKTDLVFQALEIAGQLPPKPTVTFHLPNTID